MALFISPLLAQTARVKGTVRTLAGEPAARVTIQLVNSAADIQTYYPGADNKGTARSIDIPGNGAQNFDL